MRLKVCSGCGGRLRSDDSNPCWKCVASDELWFEAQMKRLREQIEATRQSEHLTAADYAIVINCRD